MSSEHQTPGQIVSWADAHQFDAEPMPDTANRPSVYLLWMTPDPLGANAAMCKMYKGEVVRNLATITDGEREAMWEDVLKTHLTAPLESIKLHFLIEGVTRSWANQLVRQRTAVYAQESMRFAVKHDLADEAHTPPSIAALRPNDPRRQQWDSALKVVGETYNSLVSNGIPAEDARELAPHATTTRIHYATDLRNLSAHAGNRLCTQAQYLWREVFTQIVLKIKTYKPDFSRYFGQTLWMTEDEKQRFKAAWEENNRWQYEEIATSNLFRPVCYQQGHCPFKASFDRSCTIRERVDVMAQHNVPSSEWDAPYTPDGAMFPVEAINPAEWLLDPGAARKQTQWS